LTSFDHLVIWSFDDVADAPDAGQVEFEFVAVGQPLTDLHAAAGAERADTEHLAGEQVLPGEAWASRSPSPKRESAVCGRASIRPLTVTVPSSSRQCGSRTSAETAWSAKGTEEVLGLLRAHAAFHLGNLHVAGAEVAHDGESRDRAFGLLRSGVAQRLADDEGELQLVVEGTGVGRKCDRRAGGNEGHRVVEVVDGLLVPEAVGAQSGEWAAGERLHTSGKPCRPRHKPARIAVSGIDVVPLGKREVAY